MWVLVSYGKIIGEPAKSEADIAKRLGFSRQYLNKQLKKGKNHFTFKGMPVFVMRQMEFSAAGNEFETKNEMADALGVPRAAVARVFKNGTTGVVRTKEEKEVTVSQIAGSTVTACPRPLPAIRVISEVGGSQEFSSIAAAGKELGIDPKTIPNALRSGRDSFTRKFDGEKFTVEIPGEKITPQEKYKKELSKLAETWACALNEKRFDDAEEASQMMVELKVQPRAKSRFRGKPKDTMENYLKETRVIDREIHAVEDAEKMAAWVEENADELHPPEEEEEERQRMRLPQGERNPFSPYLSQIVPDSPMDPERDFLENERLIIPEGYRVIEYGEEDDDETRVLVAGPNFKSVVAEAKAYWELEIAFPCIPPPQEVWESYPHIGLFPMKVEIHPGVAEWYWRVKIIKKE